jgi:hypothetical protein
VTSISLGVVYNQLSNSFLNEYEWYVEFVEILLYGNFGQFDIFCNLRNKM